MKFSINRCVFNHITSSPSYIKTKVITLIYRSYGADCLGFVVPRVLGPANQRNRFRRQCRGAFNVIHYNNNIASVGIIVKPKSMDITYSQIEGAFNKLSNKLLKN